MRLVRNIAGWLALPASLFLSTGCSTTGDAPEPTPVATSSMVESSEIPFVQIFGQEAAIHIVTFFDLYCMACQQSAEKLAEIHSSLQEIPNGSSVQMTGVGFGDTPFELEVFLKRYHLPYTCYPDPEKNYKEPFALRGTPTVLCFARIGDECREVYRHEGRFRSEDLANLLETVQIYLPETSSPQ